jgi:signal transduction histidine kinase
VVAAVAAAVLAHIVGLVLGNQLRFLRASTTAARRLALERAGLRVAERHYLARELHDVVGHDLTRITLLGLSISGVGDEAALRGALADMRSLMSAARRSMDDLTSQLGEVGADESPAPLSRAPSDVLAEVRRVLGDSGHPVSARVDPAIDDLDALARASFTRIATEMSTNVLKHSPVGASCLMDADVSNGEVVLTMANPLGQAKVPLGHGFGLISMRERARALGSDVTTERRGGQWRIVARVPLNVTSTLPLD